MVYPKPNKTDVVEPILKSLEVDNLKTTLEAFSSFRTRCMLHCFSSSYHLVYNIVCADYRSEVLRFVSLAVDHFVKLTYRPEGKVRNG